MQAVTITKEEITYEQLDFLVNLTGTPKKDEIKEHLLRIITDYQSLTRDRDDMDVLFPAIQSFDGLDRLIKVHWALTIAQRYGEHFDSFEEFLKQDTNYLGLTMSDVCDKYQSLEKRCSHCAAGSGDGLMMDFEKLSSVDQQFFKLFEHAAFGRKGEPFLYKNKGHDLTDVVEFIASQGINEISFYFGVFDRKNKRYEEGTKRLTDLKKRLPDKTLMSGFTYHLFTPNKDGFEDGFKYALDSCFEFSDEITIELLASEVSEATSMKNTRKQFEKFKERLFEGYEVVEPDNYEGYIQKGDRKVKLTYKDPNTNVYDIGEYKETLDANRLIPKYIEIMGEKTYPPICVSTLNHKFIVIEPDGGIKTCVSFDGMHTKAGINLFDVGYGNVVSWLENRFHNQRAEVIEKLPELIYQRHSMCDCK